MKMDASVQMEMMEQHLLFHKALAEDEESLNKINGYLALLKNEAPGERLTDQMDESIRAVFSLVLERGIDPWEINLEEFARMYSEKVSNNRFDMLVAGRLLLMAWRILNLQSQETRASAEFVEEVPIEEEDFSFSDEDQLVIPDVVIGTTYAHTDPRSVTMIDLLDAFNDAYAEIENFNEAQKTIIKIRNKEPTSKFDNKAHREDDEQVVENIYQMIYSMGMDPMPITEFYTNDKEHNISVFVAVLHLVRDGKLEVSQETLPYSEILVQIKQPDNNVPLENVAAVN